MLEVLQPAPNVHGCGFSSALGTWHKPLLTFLLLSPEGDVPHSPGKPDVALQNTRRAPKDNVLQRQGKHKLFSQTFAGTADVGIQNLQILDRGHLEIIYC